MHRLCLTAFYPGLSLYGEGSKSANLNPWYPRKCQARSVKWSKSLLILHLGYYSQSLLKLQWQPIFLWCIISWFHKSKALRIPISSLPRPGIVSKIFLSMFSLIKSWTTWLILDLSILSSFWWGASGPWFESFKYEPAYLLSYHACGLQTKLYPFVILSSILQSPVIIEGSQYHDEQNFLSFLSTFFFFKSE